MHSDRQGRAGMNKKKRGKNGRDGEWGWGQSKGRHSGGKQRIEILKNKEKSKED